jgi:pSer/pThr/pTyr-binding forkhead associated (FHA) protein/uncharacterized protein involved in exopolysaccharide biosynthesis
MVNPNRTGRTIVPGSMPGSVVSGVTGHTMIPGAEPGLDKMLEVVVDGPGTSQPQAFLLVISGAEPGRLHILDRPELIIGRSKFADIRISERAMSQQHAKLVRIGDHHRLFDLGSTNGVFVNDKRIEQVDLKVGDVIRTGETVFTYMSSSGGDPGQSEATLALPSATSKTRPPTGQNPHVPAGMAGTAIALRNRLPAVRQYPPQVLQAPALDADGPDFIALMIRVLAFFRRYWLSILILTLLGVGAGVASYKFRKPPAMAKFELHLIPDASDNPVQQGRRMNFEFFRSAKQNFLRPSLINETLTELGETDITPQRIREVQQSLEFNQGRGPTENIYAGSFQAGSADEAMEFLRVHLELFLDREIEKALKVLLVEVDALEKKLAEAEEELNSTEQAILAFKQEHSEGLPEQASQLYESLIALGTEKGRVASEVARAAEESRMRKKQLKSEAPEIERRISLARPYEDTIADTKRELAKARAEGKGPDHPDVKSLKAQIQKLENLRDDVMKEGSGGEAVANANPVYESRRIALDDASTSLKVAQAEMARLTNDIARTEKIVADLPRLQQEYTELTRSYEATQKIHANLFEKLTSSKIQLDMERASASGRYDVITPPNVEPVSKIKTLIKRAGLLGMIGFFFGIGIGLLRDLRRLIAARLAQSQHRNMP